MDSRIVLLLTFALSSLLNFAAQAADEKPLVIFFGGSGTAESELALWKRSAAQQNPGYDYETIRFPAGSHKKPTALENGKEIIESISQRLNGIGNRRVILIGHSSGSALAEAVAKNIRQPKNFSYVNLDGFKPDTKLQDRMNVVCWSGINTATQGTSSNYSAMKSSCRNFREYKTDSRSCTTDWCLHFALVNRAATASGGYSSAVNLAWLEKAPAATTPTPNTPPMPAPAVANKPIPAPPSGNSGGTTMMIGEIIK